MGGGRPPLMTCVRLFGLKRVVGVGDSIYIYMYTNPVEAIQIKVERVSLGYHDKQAEFNTLTQRLSKVACVRRFDTCEPRESVKSKSIYGHTQY